MARRKKIKPIDLQAELNKILKKYADDVTACIAPSVEKAAKKGVNRLRGTGDYKDRTGAYRKSFNYDYDKTAFGATAKIYSKDPDYRRAHLLEFGHLIKDGTKRILGKTKAYPHWKPVHDEVIKEFREEVIKGIKGAGK